MLYLAAFWFFPVLSAVHAHSPWQSLSGSSPCDCFRKCGLHVFMAQPQMTPFPFPPHWSMQAQMALGSPFPSAFPQVASPPSVDLPPFHHNWMTGIEEFHFPLVLPLIHGNFSYSDDKLAMYPSVVLVIDKETLTNERKFILVDTGLSVHKDSVVSALLSYRVDPSMIDTVVITHSDTDTMGNLNLFPCAEVLSSNRIAKENFFVQQKMPTFDGNRSDLPFHKLYENTELYLTPGFGLQDHSLIVRNVENHGTVAIVGKLVLNETDLVSSNMAIRQFAIDDVEQRKLWQATRREIVCLVDFVIPGHGTPFKVSAELKTLAECQKKGSEPIAVTAKTVVSGYIAVTQKPRKWKMR